MTGPGPAAVARRAQSATVDVRDPVLAAELSFQAAAWRRLNDVLPDGGSAGDVATGALSTYVRELSVLVTSDEPHLSALAETALRRLALTGSPELQETGAPSALRVQGIERSGRDAVIVTVDVPPAARERFAGHAGQHLPLHTEVAGVPMRRSYSLLRSPSTVRTSGTLSFAVRREQRGRVSGQLVDHLGTGDRLVLSPPAGVFCLPNGDSPRHLLLLGAGSGIVPLIALAEECLERDPRNTAVLVQVERCRDDVMALELLAELGRTAGSRLRVSVEETRRAGRPDADRLADLARESAGATGPAFTHAFICGPHAFTESAADAASIVGLDPGVVLRESFVTQDAPRRRRPGGTVTVSLGDEDVTLDVVPGESLLAALLRTGRDHPYSCLSGTCGSCALQVVRGEVAPSSQDVLGTPRSDAGWVLACQAAPQ